MKIFPSIFSILLLALLSLITSSQKAPKSSSDIESIINTLNSKTIEELKPIALKLEKYWYNKRGGKILGGLHDYINLISKEDLITFCKKIIEENEELKNIQKFTEVVNSENSALNPSNIKEGLHDNIFLMPRNVLFKWALALKAFENSKNPNEKKDLLKLNKEFSNMSNFDLIQFILSLTRKYKEIDSESQLNKLSENFKIEKFINKSQKIKILKENLLKAKREDLDKFALACEFHERKGKKLFGGLHDYIRLLTNEQVIQYIIEKAEKYKELNSIEKLQKISEIQKEIKNFIKEMKFLEH